ncbi:DNA methyltransferase [Tepidibacillus marianensis]|uniref:DNA methyltransferase n=1 Tax=Tepidibacillus marianensis TaxID=3131995 RepID=UPI0030D0A7A3
MEERKLIKEDIDRVRDIEGFPIAKDEDIIALSRPPYYTACPNPFIEDFIREHGTAYDEATDDYHCEPFAADVSEGKNDPIYMAHSYHTKVPYKAIMRYILHYTKPGDIVFDGFCGTGMTGVAAQMCGYADAETKMQINSEMKGIEWGARYAILNDLSPIATSIAGGYNAPLKRDKFNETAKTILDECDKKYGWMYETQHVQNGKLVKDFSGKNIIARMNYMVWSDIYVCPSCSKELTFYDVAFNEQTVKMHETFICPHCGSSLQKKDCDHAWVLETDLYTGEQNRVIKQVPVRINYSVGKTRYTKKPDEYDFKVLDRINQLKISAWFPTDRMCEGSEGRRNDRIGLTNVYQFYTKRNLIVLSYLHEKCQHSQKLMFWFTSCLPKLTIMNRYMPQHGSRALVGPMAGTLYVSPLWVENEVISQFTFQLPKIGKAAFANDNIVAITTQSMLSMPQVPENSIDYIFTDPPFGSNLQYSELSCLWEAWIKVKTANKTEAIVNKSHNKNLDDYRQLMFGAFQEYYRILKPGHWITVEFHNSQNSVWNTISETLGNAGFIIAHVQVLDKKKGTILQLTTFSAVQQDLVISAYKPKESFIREFELHAGDINMAWEFVSQHLQNLPVAPDSTGKIEIVSERQDYLLFDRMVAFHIMNGIPVPMDSHTFYAGLRERFIQRDGMFFLPDQVNEYDERRQIMELQDQQLSLFITDEKSAIIWLNAQLGQIRQTYSEIQPKFLQDWHRNKFEQMPELLDMLKENFLQDEEGKWYVPDLSDKADLEKLRRKRLLKDFYDIYAKGTGRIKNARTEAIRVGFDECWKDRNYSLIVKVGDRLPEAVLQEDPALLMYYDNATNRM